MRDKMVRGPVKDKGEQEPEEKQSEFVRYWRARAEEG